MNKKMLVISVAAAFIVSAFAAMSVYSQEDVESVRDSAFGVRMRDKVAFMHDEHNEKAGIDDCTECHHVYDEEGVKLEDESSEDRECSECHMAGGKDKMDLMRAYHLNCKGCHEEQKAGPVMCAECHEKG
ncbi:acidic cytochrome c3 [Desulfonema ishimotonii]|uniref:Acidic cytochrome c3 n=1 Tax=Desulfonema ishimotonii TaxID=45657 RepID=A0A401FZE5_9BACT|nr:cytochrome c3 family protein [Desulfonema ishimotonii]GBC62330.1 acidic cytochrome c3 [Desulfonema ishimotonii]